MLVVSYWRPRPQPYRAERHHKAVDLTPWRWGPLVALLTLGLLVLVYLLCSPWGLASRDGLDTPFWAACGTLALVVAIGTLWVIKRFVLAPAPEH